MVLDAKRAAELFQQMHEAADHPEKAEKLAHPPREKRPPKRETKPPVAPPLDHQREWEKIQDERDARFAEHARGRDPKSSAKQTSAE